MGRSVGQVNHGYCSSSYSTLSQPVVVVGYPDNGSIRCGCEACGVDGRRGERVVGAWWPVV